MSSTCHLLNTHFYDSTIKQVYDELVLQDNLMDPLLPSEPLSKEAFSAFVTEVSAEIAQNFGDIPISRSAQKALHLFLQDDGNNVNGNGLDVKEIFPRVWAQVRALNLQNSLYIIEQLADIVDSGPCSNGRINRLVQIKGACTPL
jgi:hypothetical protein